MISMLDYVDARLAMLKAEAGEAASAAIHAVVLFAAALTCGVVCYLTGVCALTIWMSRAWWHGDLLPAVAVIAVVHFVLAITALLLARRRFSPRHLFRHSLQELQTDKQWLHHPPPASLS